MPILRLEQSVPNFAQWKSSFDKDTLDRKGGGVRRYTLLRSPSDEHYLIIDMEFGTTKEAEAFQKKLEAFWAGPGKEMNQNPSARILEVAETKDV